MENCIVGAKKLIDRQVFENKIIMFGNAFSEYQKAYFWTNENIAEYLNLVSFSGKSSALSVLASGDHVFNLITQGIYNIDTFDINRFTEYYALGLKKAMIMKFNYYDFMNILNVLLSIDTSNEEISEIIYSLLPFMDKKYRLFWSEINDYNIKAQKENSNHLNIIYMLFIGINNHTNYLKNNNYLLNETNYNLLKERFNKANINFKFANAITLNKEFNKRYDFILLSNILDYFTSIWGYNWSYKTLLEYEKNLENISKKDAIIFLNYIMRYCTNFKKRKNIFLGSDVKTTDFQDEEIFTIQRNNEKHIYDGIVLKRCK